jgi:predicted nucleic acid-binding protein
MSAESPEFVDSNILVYAFDPSAGPKKVAAERLLDRLWQARTGCVSLQVLQEFFVTVTRKTPHPLSIDEGAQLIRELASWRVFAPTVGDILNAITLQKQAKLSFWDAMVVNAAAELGCEVLWTEDLNDSQLLRGVRIQNPFAS